MNLVPAPWWFDAMFLAACGLFSLLAIWFVLFPGRAHGLCVRLMPPPLVLRIMGLFWLLVMTLLLWWNWWNWRMTGEQ
jgi:hypothetical protein